MLRDWLSGGDGRKVPDLTWKPHTTVAALCENQGKFLLVKEKDQNRIVFNQPAGHLEPGGQPGQYTD